MNNVFVVAVSGWKKSGKDMIADHLVSKHNFTRTAFADTLKEMTAEKYNLDLECFYDQEKKELPLMHLPVDPQDAFSDMIAHFMLKEFKSQEGHATLRFHKNDYPGEFRVFTENSQLPQKLYWTPRALLILEGSCARSVTSQYWVDRTISKMSRGGLFVIPDLRYRSEIATLQRKLGESAICVRLERFDTIDSVDPSERDLDDYDFQYRIKNRQGKQFALDRMDEILKTEQHKLPKNTDEGRGGEAVGRSSPAMGMVVLPQENIQITSPLAYSTNYKVTFADDTKFRPSQEDLEEMFRE